MKMGFIFRAARMPLFRHKNSHKYGTGQAPSVVQNNYIQPWCMPEKALRHVAQKHGALSAYIYRLGATTTLVAHNVGGCACQQACAAGCQAGVFHLADAKIAHLSTAMEVQSQPISSMHAVLLHHLDINQITFTTSFWLMKHKAGQLSLQSLPCSAMQLGVSAWSY